MCQDLHEEVRSKSTYLSNVFAAVIALRPQSGKANDFSGVEDIGLCGLNTCVPVDLEIPIFGACLAK